MSHPWSLRLLLPCPQETCAKGPGYEAVHELVHDAVSEGVVAPSISSGFYLQCEIWDVLKSAKYRTSPKTSHC
jgi:hypothetical protein